MTRADAGKAFLALMLAVAIAYVLIVISDAQGETPYEASPSIYDTRLSELDREALDEAYKKYRIELFQSWMKDPTKQPQRAMMGAEKARAVYIKVLEAIGQRPSEIRTPSREGMPPGMPRERGK